MKWLFIIFSLVTTYTLTGIQSKLLKNSHIIFIFTFFFLKKKIKLYKKKN
jgi:hypothetical protein